MLGVLLLAPLLGAQTRSGLTDGDGKAIPEFVSSLPFPGEKPAGYLELDDFNARAHQLVGTRAVVDGGLRGVTWWNDGPAVQIFDKAGMMPSSFDFVVDPDMQAAVRTLTANTHAGTLPVRMTGTVRNSAAASWKIFVIDELSLIGPSGDPVWTAKRTKPHDSSLQRDPSTPRSPARFNPATSRTVRANATQPPVVTGADANAPQAPVAAAGTAAWIVFAVLAAIFLAVVFAIFAVVYFVMKAKNRSRDNDDYDYDDEEDDEEDDRPRRRRRRPEDRD
jgi:hypothetical protein